MRPNGFWRFQNRFSSQWFNFAYATTCPPALVGFHVPGFFFLPFVLFVEIDACTNIVLVLHNRFPHVVASHDGPHSFIEPVRVKRTYKLKNVQRQF